MGERWGGREKENELEWGGKTVKQEIDISRSHMVTKAELSLNSSKTGHPDFPVTSCVTLPLHTDSASQVRMTIVRRALLLCAFGSGVT